MTISSKQIEICLTPVNNLRLSALCGALESNIDYLSYCYDISISRKSERFILRGEEAKIIEAANALRTLYELTEDGERVIEYQDINFIQQQQLQDSSASARGHSEQPNVAQAQGQGQGQLNEHKSSKLKRRQMRPLSIRHQRFLQLAQANDVLICNGPAGSGKTFLSASFALQQLRNKQVDRIILSRPIREAAGEKLGFLPGDLGDKINPYLQPLVDVFGHFLKPREIEKMMTEQVLSFVPLAFMRGLTFDNALVIFDEAQNSTIVQMKLILTRLGIGTRILINGDSTQFDLPEPEGLNSGLTDAIVRLQSIDGVAVICLTQADVLRSDLAQKISLAYEYETETQGHAHQQQPINSKFNHNNKNNHNHNDNDNSKTEVTDSHLA